jgi:hypothetical protein
VVGVSTAWRDYMLEKFRLEWADPDTTTILAGRRRGVSRDRDRIAVFVGPWRTGEVTEVARASMVVRYWKRRSKQLAPDEQPDPTELEDARDAMLVVLRAHQRLDGLDRPWYYILRTATIDEDPDEWGVEFELEGFTANVAVIA